MLQVILTISLPLIVQTHNFFSSSPLPWTPCLNKILEEYFSKDKTLWISTKNCSQIQNLIWTNTTFLVTSPKFQNSYQESFWELIDNYLLEASDDAELATTIQKVKQLHSWNSHGRFLIWTSPNAYHFDALIDVLWASGVYNFLLAVPAVHQVEFHTWYPYRNCSSKVTDTILVGSCNKGQLEFSKKLFQGKIPSRATGCTLKVGAVIWPPFVLPAQERIANTDNYILTDGIEVRLITIISQQLNMSVEYSLSEKSLNWGDLYQNGTATGLMAKLREKTIDVAIASLVPTAQRLSYFEFTSAYFFEKFSWCVPHAALHSSLQKMLDVVDPLMAGVFLLVFFTSSGLFYWVSALSYAGALQVFFSVALGVAVKQRPRGRKLRLIFFVWIVFSFDFGLLFETKLISILAHPRFGPQVSTVKELVQSNLRFQFMPNALTYFDKNDVDAWSKIKGIEECSEMSDCFNHVVYLRDGALCLSSSYTDYIKKSYTTKENIPLIHCFDSHLATYPVLMLMKKGFPLGKTINTIVMRLVEGGFVQFWAQQILTEKWKKEEASLSKEERQSLNLDKLTPAFVCLGIGTSASILVFFGEILVFFGKLLKDKRIVVQVNIANPYRRE